MTNYKKPLYTTPEIGQILGVTPTTVRQWINKGELHALCDDKITKGCKRRIRVTKKQLCEYIEKHQKYLERETVEAFLKASKETSKEEKPDADLGEAYTVSDISELSGAWAGLSEVYSEKVNTVDTKEDSRPKTYKLLCDGRIMVCNIQKDTMKTILNALLEDECFSPKSIAVEFGGNDNGKYYF